MPCDYRLTARDISINLRVPTLSPRIRLGIFAVESVGAAVPGLHPGQDDQTIPVNRVLTGHTDVVGVEKAVLPGFGITVTVGSRLSHFRPHLSRRPGGQGNPLPQGVIDSRRRLGRFILSPARLTVGDIGPIVSRGRRGNRREHAVGNLAGHGSDGAGDNLVG